MWKINLFKESRFVAMADDGAEAVPTEAEEAAHAPDERDALRADLDGSKEFINKFLEKDILYPHGTLNFEKFVKDNPYAAELGSSDLPEKAKDFRGFVAQGGAGALEIYFETADTRGFREAKEKYAATQERADLDPEGKLKEPEFKDFVKGENIKPYKIEGFQYVALMWPHIKDSMFRKFALDSVGSKVVIKAAQDRERYPHLAEFVLDYAKNFEKKNFNPALYAPALRELLSLQRKGGVETFESDDSMMSDAEEASLVKEFGVEYVSERTAGFEPISDDEMSKKYLDIFKANVERRRANINADTWRPANSAKDMAITRRDFEKMGFKIDDSPFRSMFNQLSKAYNENYLSGKGPDMAIWMKDPDRYREHITDQSFLKAWDRFRMLRDTLIAQDYSQRKSEEGVDSLGHSKIMDGLLGGLKKNAHVITEAVRKGDWGTVAVYAGGLWAVIHLWRKSDDKGFIGALKDAAPWVLVGLAAVTAAEAAGIPVSEKLGLTSKYDAVIGTNLEAWLRDSRIPELQDIDGQVYTNASKMNLRELYSGISESHVDSNTETGWIDPMKFEPYNAEFRGLFGSVTEKRNKDPKYKHVGEQLYKIAKGMESIYTITLKANKSADNPYAGQRFEDILARPPLNHATVHDFLGAVAPFAQGVEATSEVSGAADDVFDRAFKGLDAGRSDFISEDVDKDGKKELTAMLMGVPVVVKLIAGRYMVYYRTDFAKNPGTAESIGSIPSEGETVADGAAVRDALIARFQKIYSEKNPTGGKAEWENGKWVVKKEVPEINRRAYSAWGVDADEAERYALSIGNNGEINTVGIETAKLKVLEKIVNDPDYSFLNPILGKFPEKFVVEFDHDGLKLSVADLEIVIFNDGHGDILPQMSNDLIDAPEFRKLYFESLLDSSFANLDSKVSAINDKLEKAPQDWWVHFKQSVTGSLDGKLFDGQIPQKRTEMLLRSMRYDAATRILHRFDSSSFEDLTDLGAYQADVENRMADGLDKVYEAIDVNHDSTAEEFKQNVLREIYNLGGSNFNNDNRRQIAENFYQDASILGSDLMSDFHLKVEARLKAYSYWALDNMRVGSDVVDVDHISKPTNEPSKSPGYLDTAWTGWYMRAYNDYVKAKVVAYAPTGDTMPSPTDSEKWHVKPFKEWALSEANLTLRTLDTLAPLSNDDGNHSDFNKIKLSSLEKEIKERLLDKLNELRVQETSFNWEVVEPDLLTPFAASMDDPAAETGLFMPYRFKGDTVNYDSMLWLWARQVDGLSTKGQQNEAIESLINRIVVSKFLKPEYFKGKPSDGNRFTDWLKIKFPGLITTPILNHLVN